MIRLITAVLSTSDLHMSASQFRDFGIRARSGPSVRAAHPRCFADSYGLCSCMPKMHAPPARSAPASSHCHCALAEEAPTSHLNLGEIQEGSR